MEIELKWNKNRIENKLEIELKLNSKEMQLEIK